MAQIIQLNPADKNLSIHPLLKNLPAWESDSERFEKFADSIWEQGVIEPIKVTKNFEIVDGRHRWRAAKVKRLEAIPAIQITDEEVASVILTTLLQRRHYTPSQRAYALAPMIQSAFEEAQRRKQHRSLTTGNTAYAQHTRSIGVSPKTVEEWAEEIGVGLRILQTAKQLHELFDAHKEKRTLTDKEGNTEKGVTFREFFEKRIFDEESPYGLGGVVAGVQYLLETEKNPSKKNGGQPKNVDRQLQLFTDTIRDELNRWQYWQKFDEETKAQHFKEVRTSAARLPSEQCEALAEYHLKLSKEFSKAAKKEEKQ